jgi:hypothetical protein
MQHVVGTIYSFALSGCSVPYLAGSLLFNSWGIIQLWRKETSNDGKRWVNVLICVLVYTAPILWRKDLYNYSVVAASMAVGGISFIPELNKKFMFGWGHTFFHLTLGIYGKALADSARLIPLY